MEFGRSAFPQYLVYSDCSLLKTLNNYSAAKFVIRVREIVKNENESQKNQKRASVAQNHKVGHLGATL